MVSLLYRCLHRRTMILTLQVPMQHLSKKDLITYRQSSLLQHLPGTLVCSMPSLQLLATHHLIILGEFFPPNPKAIIQLPLPLFRPKELPVSALERRLWAIDRILPTVVRAEGAAAGSCLSVSRLGSHRRVNQTDVTSIRCRPISMVLVKGKSQPAGHLLRHTETRPAPTNFGSRVPPTAADRLICTRRGDKKIRFLFRILISPHFQPTLPISMD